MIKNDTIEINYDEITDEQFTAYIYHGDTTIEIQGKTCTDEIENLWGDQVSSVSLMAYFDGLTDYRVCDENGNEMNSVNLELAKKIDMTLRRSMDEEIESLDYHVDYSPKYYDLV